MKQNKGKIIVGVFVFLMAIGFFTLQMGYFYVHQRFQVEYIDNRLYYVITILCVSCLALAIFILLTLSKRIKVIVVSIVSAVFISQVVLLSMSNNEIKHVTSISPDFIHVLSLKENLLTGEIVYYRPYFGIFGRPRLSLPYEKIGDFKVEWLAKDVAAVTYLAANQTIQQFIGTYGDRGSGSSYYNVGPEMHGVWQGNGVEVKSSPEGIEVTADGESELFAWESVYQFGTLAIVLKRDDEAAWTISLNENFTMYSDASIPPSGNITLYKAEMEKSEPYILERTGG